MIELTLRAESEPPCQTINLPPLFDERTNVGLRGVIERRHRIERILILIPGRVVLRKFPFGSECDA